MRSLAAKNQWLSAHDSLVGIFEDTCRKVRGVATVKEVVAAFFCRVQFLLEGCGRSFVLGPCVVREGRHCCCLGVPGVEVIMSCIVAWESWCVGVCVWPLG